MNDKWISALKDGDAESVGRLLADHPELAMTADRRLDVFNDGRFEVYPLRFAASRNDRQVVAALLAAGADLTALDVTRNNILQCADDVEMVEFLIQKGADVNAIGYETGNAVILASAKAQVEKVRCLISHGADVTQPATNDGRTAIHVAASWAYQGQRSAEVIRLLVAHGADINARDQAAKTPLHWAADGNIEALKLLLELGADISVRDTDGKRPMDYAEDEAAVALLR